MDPLSELLADVRIRDVTFVRTRLGSQGVLRVGQVSQPCFHLVTEGRLWLHRDEHSVPLELKTGDIAFFPQGQPHALSAHKLNVVGGSAVDLMAHWAQASTSLVDAMPGGEGGLCVARSLSGRMRIEGVSPAWLCGGLPPCLTLQWGTQALPDWLSIGLTYLDNELRSEHLARQAVIDRLGDILFIQSLRVYLSGPSQAPTGWLMGLKDGMISRVLGAIHREPDRPWQLAELAKVGCVSRSVLAARFTQVLGVPPQAYLTQHRMHLAAKYLQDTAVPVLEVARLVGYQSAAAFAQAFKRAMGCSPTDYRARPAIMA
jgi:AraC-like DNA-binding protein